LELEEVKLGEVLDCEACGATLKAALSSRGDLRLEVIALRRILFQGAPDLLEFTLPSGSVYAFPFRKALAYLRPFLRR
jgi:hypothetical protein